MNDRDFCIIGYGGFGASVALTLKKLGKNVIVLDSNPKSVEKALVITKNSIVLDATDIYALKNFGIQNIDNVIVAIAGSNIEASVLTIANLQEIGVKNIIAEAKDERHKRILKALGVQTVTIVDEYAGQVTAYHALWKINIDIYDVSESYIIAGIIVKNNNIVDMPIKFILRYSADNFIPITIQRKKKMILTTSDTRLQLDDRLVFLANNKYVTDIYTKLTDSKFKLTKTQTMEYDPVEFN